MATTSPARRRLLDYPDAAQYMGTTERHIRELWATRRLTGVKLGGRVRFDQADLDAYIEANKVRAS